MLYLLGVLFWKFSLETMSTCISGIVLNRLGHLPNSKSTSEYSGITWTAIQSLNMLMQAIGALLVGPLFKRFRPCNVLGISTAVWGLIILIIPTMELASNGIFPQELKRGSSNPTYWGTWDPHLLYLVYPLAGLFMGIVEVVRQIMPAYIMGSDLHKLEKMDSMIKMVNELVGAVGSVSAVYWISYSGWGYGLLIIPVGFSIAAFLWLKLEPSDQQLQKELELKRSPTGGSERFNISHIIYSSFYTISYGAKIVLYERNLIWLIPSFALPMVCYKYVEGTLYPFYAKHVLMDR